MRSSLANNPPSTLEVATRQKLAPVIQTRLGHNRQAFAGYEEEGNSSTVWTIWTVKGRDQPVDVDVICAPTLTQVQSALPQDERCVSASGPWP